MKIWPYLADLRRYLHRLADSADVDDLIQDILLRICRCRWDAPITHPKRYLFQVAQAAMIDSHRREASRCGARHCELADTHHPLDELSPLRIMLAREDMRTTETALRALPDRTREIIIAMRLDGGSLKSLAQHYGISTGAVEKHVTRALKALAQHHDSLNRGWIAPTSAPVPLPFHS